MNNEEPFSYKPLITLGILIGVISLTALIPAKWFGVSPISKKTTLLDLSVLPSANEIAKDTNGDGVVSWKEIVGETLTDSSTTDSLKKTQTDPKAIERLNDPNNLTSSFSKNLYLTSAYLNKNGISDTNSEQTALNQLITEEASKITPTSYTYTDLNIAKKEDKTSIKDYGNKVAPILQAVTSKKIIAYDISSLDSFLQTKNESDLVALTRNRDHLNAILKLLQTISVPPSAIPYHILMLNRIALYRDTVENMAKAKTDPVRAKISLEQYTNNILLVLRISNQLSDYFNIQNIIFSAEEPGYMFTTGYTIFN